MNRRGLLLDRDGVVNIDRGYVATPEKFTFMLGLFPFLRAAQDLGFRLAIVTNQSGVARGFYTVADYEKLTEIMLKSLKQEGIAIDLTLACFEYSEGTVPEFKRESFWRKPNPGMILEAAQKLNLDLSQSVMIGDKDSDMAAAKAAGVGTRILLDQEGAKKIEGVTTLSYFSQALRLLYKD